MILIACSFTENDGSGYELETGKGFVRLFLAGLSQLKDFKLLVRKDCGDEDVAFLNLLFESQNEILTTSALGDDSTVRTVQPNFITPHDAYILGYCISLSRCQWGLQLHYIGDEQADMMKRAIANWGCGKGRIIRVSFHLGKLTSDGIGHLLSLPHSTLGGLIELDLTCNNLTSKSCDMLFNYMSSLHQLEKLYLCCSRIGFEGAQMLSNSLQTNSTLKELDLSDNGIGDRGACSLAKALSVNKCLERLFLRLNQIGCEGAQLLSQSLQTNTTLRELGLSGNDIRDRGPCSLAKALSVNNVLEKLILSNN